MLPAHKRHLRCCSQAIVDAINHQERFVCGINVISNGSKCDSETVSAVIKFILLNEDPKLLFVLVLNLRQWIRHLRNLVKIGDNTDGLVVSCGRVDVKTRSFHRCRPER